MKDVFLGGHEPRGLGEQVRAFLAQPEQFVEGIHAVGRAAGLLVELGGSRAPADGLGIGRAASVRPGDHASQRLPGSIQGDQAVQRAADADPVAGGCAHPGLFDSGFGRLDHPRQHRCGVLLVPFLLLGG
jgi:hypothetical protein